MKRFFALTIMVAMTLGCAIAQQPQHQHHQAPVHLDTTPMRHAKSPHGGHHHQHRADCPHARQHSAVSQADATAAAIKSAFPTMQRTNKTARWTEVFDAQGTLLGYAVSSKPASDGIKGYNGETPVVITLNAKKRITGVYALPNSETPRFAQRVEQAGFYDNWNGLSIKKARKKKVDTVSGATFTSRAVIQSVQAALSQL